jgi:putative DNA primase/helicase
VTITEFLSLSKIRESVRKTGTDRWQCLCPAHADNRTKSLCIGVGDDGRILLDCKAGCKVDDVCEALGVKLSDLFPSAIGSTGKRCSPNPSKPKRPYSSIADAGRSIAKRIQAQCSRPVRFTQHWVYHNADGSESFVALRFDYTDGSPDEKPDKTFRPIHLDGRGYVEGDPSGLLPLYGLHSLNESPTVFVVEGEKCVEAARSIGLCATTSAHGANSTNKTDFGPLAGRDVVILPDNDDGGRKYAQEVTAVLTGLRPAAKVKIVELPGLPAKGDIYDWLEMHDASEPSSLRAVIEGLVNDAPAVDASEMTGGPMLQCLADIEPTAIKWLWPGRIPLGRISLLVGRPGEGKSFLTTYMAARVSTGSPWPDGSDCPKGSVILISAEDDPADTIRPRLDAHYADTRRVHLLSTVRRIDDDGEHHDVMFTLHDVAALETALRRHPDCKLVVVDPIGSFLGGRTDAHRDNEVRAILAPVAVLAQRYGVAVLVVAHRRKSSGSMADDLALGSRAFTAIARAVWHLTRDGENKARRLLLPGKNNLAHEGGGLAFTICGEPAAIVWEHDLVTMTADDALATENSPEPKRPGPKPAARDKAAEWLQDMLKNGPMEAGKIKEEAVAAGYAWRTVQRAKDDLGIIPHRHQFGGTWIWRLPVGGACQDVRRQDPENVENLASWHHSDGNDENGVFGKPDVLSCQVDDSGMIEKK